ncbi:hypothetical protein MBLNU230_g3315t1 [Neophaeotheca triangularis]
MGERLFKPLQLGRLTLDHRMVMAPLTRFRANDDHVPGPYSAQYYAQRASVPGTLIVTEATFISPRAGGYKNVPGLWNEEQVAAWKEITDAVHAKGSYVYCQLWALGRVAMPNVLERTGNRVVSSSNTPLDSDHAEPHALSVEEIQGFVSDYANAARNAMKAGFDGVEIHGANGYLIDQFWQDVVNQRSDEYGGSVEKRARFGLEVTKAVIEATGDSKKVAIRLSPFSNFQGMKMADPLPQFLHIVSELKELDLAYLHLVESRVSGTSAADAVYGAATRENDSLVELWGTQAPIMLAGGFTPEKAKKVLGEIYTEENVCIAFGRAFISNPDLPFRIRNAIELQRWDRKTFYKRKSPDGYIDYPFSMEWLSKASSKL